MEVILLWKKPKTFFDLSIIPNIITEKWGYSPECKNNQRKNFPLIYQKFDFMIKSKNLKANKNYFSLPRLKEGACSLFFLS